MASSLVSCAGQVQSLRVDWRGELPAVGDVLLARNGRGGWVLARIERVCGPDGSSDRLALLGRRFDGVEPPGAVGRVTHPWTRTGQAAGPCERSTTTMQDVRPVSIFTVAQITARAKAMREREAAEAAALPRQSGAREWADPDSPVNQKVPKLIKGRRRCDQVGHLAKTSNSFSREEISALEAIKCSYDIARIGFSSGYALIDRVGEVAPVARAGPSATARKTLRHQKEIARLFETLGPSAATMLETVVLKNGGIPAWCAAHPNADGTPMDRKVAIGKLTFVAQRAVEWFDERRDRLGDRHEGVH